MHDSRLPYARRLGNAHVPRIRAGTVLCHARAPGPWRRRAARVWLRPLRRPRCRWVGVRHAEGTLTQTPGCRDEVGWKRVWGGAAAAASHARAAHTRRTLPCVIHGHARRAHACATFPGRRCTPNNQQGDCASSTTQPNPTQQWTLRPRVPIPAAYAAGPVTGGSPVNAARTLASALVFNCYWNGKQGAVCTKKGLGGLGL
eukprot:39607-Chlamydomonas_euryale.AAC.2